MKYRTKSVWITACLALALGLNSPNADGQLQITEVMYDSVDDSNWEWFEVRNSGATAIDLDGYFVDDNGGNAISSDADPNIWNIANGGQATNTMIPAGGVAVLYDGTALGFDDNRFRAAWQLSPSVPVIGVGFFPGLNNGGDAFGLWPNLDTYNMDVGDGDGNGTFEVLQFTNATTSLDYDAANGFPDGSEASIAWNGMGDYQDGNEWSISEDGVNGATTSIETFLPGMSLLNDARDIGNPGVIPATTAASGLLITELMYNPRSDNPSEAAWEWIEVHNNTGAEIDFSATPYVLDDVGGDPLSEANVSSGSIADGETAILFNASNSLENMQMAWGAENNYIPVMAWSSLNNGGDHVGIWTSFGADYLAAKESEDFATATIAVDYADDAGWPADDGNASIYLSDLSLDPADGFSWVLSNSEDGLSSNATQLFADGQPVDHPGGDVGSPGTAPGVDPPTNPADFNGDTLVDCDDIDLLYGEIASGENNPAFDLNSDDAVNGDDIPSFLQSAADARGFAEAIRPGDADLSGTVDPADLNVVGVNWLNASATSWCQGDFTHDGNVNANDLNALGVNWLSDVTGNQAPLSSAVPEPSGTCLLVMGLLLIWRRCRWSFSLGCSSTPFSRFH